MKRHRIITAILMAAGILLFGAGFCGCMETGFANFNIGLAATTAGSIMFTVGTILRRGLMERHN